MALNPYAGSSLNPYAGSPAAKPAGQYSMYSQTGPASSAIYGTQSRPQGNTGYSQPSNAAQSNTGYTPPSRVPATPGYGNAQMRGQSTNLGFTSGNQYNAGGNAGTQANAYAGQGYQAPARQPSLLDPNNSGVAAYNAQQTAAQQTAQPEQGLLNQAQARPLPAMPNGQSVVDWQAEQRKKKNSVVSPQMQEYLDKQNADFQTWRSTAQTTLNPQQLQELRTEADRHWNARMEQSRESTGRAMYRESREQFEEKFMRQREKEIAQGLLNQGQPQQPAQGLLSQTGSRLPPGLYQDPKDPPGLYRSTNTPEVQRQNEMDAAWKRLQQTIAMNGSSYRMVDGKGTDYAPTQEQFQQDFASDYDAMLDREKKRSAEQLAMTKRGISPGSIGTPDEQYRQWRSTFPILGY